MRKVIVSEWMSLDGVVQAPSYPDEDTDGGFGHGGWHAPFFDAESRQWVLDGIVSAGGFIFGRRTYAAFAAFWPHAGEAEQALARPLNTKPKYVATTTLRDPLDWENATVLPGSAPEAVRRLKDGDGGDLHVIGSAQLARALVAHGLVDELRLMIDPIMLGGGKSIFTRDNDVRTLRLADSQVTSTGAILATYALAAA